MKKRVFEVPVKPVVKLTEDDVDSIMVSALEGGINYWCSEAEVVEERRCADWGHEQIARGGALILHDAESDDKWELSIENFIKGFRLWLENGDDRYGAVDDDGTVYAGEIDGEMADCIIQYALFGEVVFG